MGGALACDSADQGSPSMCQTRLARNELARFYLLQSNENPFDPARPAPHTTFSYLPAIHHACCESSRSSQHCFLIWTKPPKM